MKKILLLSTTLLFVEFSYSQSCIPNAEIITTDSTLCAGDTTTLSFPAFNIDSTQIPTPIVNNNGQDGNMFDITATNTIRIKYFEGNIANTPNATTEYYIYYKVGTHVGFENNSAAWTLLAGPLNFNPNIPNTLTRIPYYLNLVIPAGQTYAFYLTNTSVATNNNRYHNGIATGTVLASNSDLTVYEGTGGAYPFGTFFNARPWEGNIIYDYPISYLWNTGATTSTIQVSPSVDSNYSCVVTFTGCSVEDTIAITVNDPQVFLGNDTTICAGSGFTLDAGNPGATYNWCDGSTTQTTNVLAAGIHCVTITDSLGCTASDSVNINIAALPNVSYGVAVNDSVCYGDSMGLFGIGADTYTWSDGIIDNTFFLTLVSDTFVVTGTDLNGCSNTDTAEVTVMPLPTVGFTVATNDTICEGTSITLSGTGAATYFWSGGVDDGISFTPSSSNSYFMMGIDTFGCYDFDTAHITVYPLPSVDLGADIVQPSPPVILDAGNGFASYIWNTTATTQTISVSTNGTYIVTVTDVNGCGSDSDTIHVTFTTGIQNPDGSIPNIQLYPIPCDDFFNLNIQNLETENMTIHMMDLKGSIIQTYSPVSVQGNFIQTFDITSLSPGIYIMEIKMNGNSEQIKFIKK